jgi:hypothetical protein
MCSSIASAISRSSSARFVGEVTRPATGGR